MSNHNNNSLFRPNVNRLFFDRKLSAQERLTELRKNHPGLAEWASQNIPFADVVFVVDRLPDDLPNTVMIPPSLTLNRLLNPICEACGFKARAEELMLCSKCCLSWFCDTRCATKYDGGTHRLRCCNWKGPLDLGHQGITVQTVIRLEQVGRDRVGKKKK